MTAVVAAPPAGSPGFPRDGCSWAAKGVFQLLAISKRGASAMAAGHGGDWRFVESALRSSLRLLRDKWGPRGSPAASGNGRPTEEEDEEQQQPSALEALPVSANSNLASSSRAACARNFRFLLRWKRQRH